MAEINIIKIDGKPLEKLIEVVSIGIGKLYKPTEIRKVANAEAYKIKVIEKALAKSKASSNLIDIETQEKIQNRLLHQEIKRQINIENVTFKTAQHLQHEKNISSEALDDDWITRFFDTVQDISDDQLQDLWSRILLGEIKKPKSFSLRTLEFLKNLSQEDAKLLTKVAEFAISISTTNFIYYKPCHKSFSEKWNFFYSDMLYLIELGIINPNDADYHIRGLDKGSSLMCQYGKNKGIMIERNINGESFALTATPFTKLGNELLKLIEKQINEDYLNEFCVTAKSGRPDIDIKIGYKVSEDSSYFVYDES
ncbi:DUF2806 domain-containing protein [Flavobacterium sp. 3HN19-14]|uniref:DUF2806 domain-containing protein n=1 Tax=Flavobacterium sp. 3HN19-14 TaxID=3448133 RepID=UPI003EE132F1